MEPIGHDTDDVHALRSRLDEYERQWRSAEARLAAFARLEELAQAQATTPEALAGRAALARTEARLTELEAEVERLEQERDHGERLLEQVTADLERRSADLDAVEREVTALLVTRAERASEVDELTRSRDELCAEVAEFLDGLEDLRAFEAGEQGPRSPSPAGVLAGATPPEYEDEDDSAFAQFFGTDFEHDKSREWILSEADGPGAPTGS